MMLAIAGELISEVYMLDMQTAFLNADVAENVSVKTAPDYETNDIASVPRVNKLKKSLYVLR